MCSRLALSSPWYDPEWEKHPRGRVKGHRVSLYGGGEGKQGQEGSWVRTEGVPFLGHGMSCPDGTEKCSYPDNAQPKLWLTTCLLLCLVLGHDLRCP